MKPSYSHQTNTDALVIMVMTQRAHLAVASHTPEFTVGEVLCGLPRVGVETVGVVDDIDLPALQDFNICIECRQAFRTNIRDSMLARVEAGRLEHEPQFDQARLVFAAKQIPLF